MTLRQVKVKIIYTDGNNKDFLGICKELDKSLNENVPGRVAAGINSVFNYSGIKDVFLLYRGKKVIGSASLWQHDDIECELIRVFISEEYRGRRYVGKLVRKVEKLAKQKGYKKIILRTFSSTPYAIHAYKRIGYLIVAPSEIKNTDKYADALALSELRVYMSKDL